MTLIITPYGVGVKRMLEGDAQTIREYTYAETVCWLFLVADLFSNCNNHV